MGLLLRKVWRYLENLGLKWYETGVADGENRKVPAIIGAEYSLPGLYIAGYVDGYRKNIKRDKGGELRCLGK